MKKIWSSLIVIFAICLSISAACAVDQKQEQKSNPPLVWNAMEPVKVTTDDRDKPQQPVSEEKTAQDNLTKNTQNVTDAIPKQADFAYIYRPNEIYKVYCNPERIVDVQLQPGEEIVYIGGADTVRWIIDKDVSGTGASKQFHIFIKPEKDNISTSLIITTDKHVYHLDLYAKDFYTPIINWKYESEDKMAFIRQQETEQQKAVNTISLGSENMTLENLNFKYDISGGSIFNNIPWKPVLVFDDGQKTYLQMPASMKTSEAPALFIKDGKELALVNYRIKNNYYIMDRLAEAFELHIGKNIVKIKRQAANPQN